MIKNPYSEIFQEIEAGLWEHDVRVDDGIALPYKYSKEDLRACTKIFMSAMLWRLWVFAGDESLPYRERLAEMCGETIRKLILNYTGIDMHDLYKD